MKRITLALILALTLAFTPALALAEAPANASDASDASDAAGEPFEDAGDIFSPEIWVVPEDGGLTWDESSMTIALPEDAQSGYAWSAELDEESVLTLETDAVNPAADGALPVHTYVYKPASDGEALVSLFYEQQDGDAIPAMLNYTATIEGGKIVDVEYDDLSDWDSQDGDAEGVLYTGESGGVPLYLPEGMAVVSEEEGVTRLENEDQSIWMTIQYDSDGDAEALLGEFEDEDGLVQEYTDASKGLSFLSASVDRESDPPRGTLVYEIVEGGTDTIVEHIGYEAPSGGVLIVDTGYLM
jgi:predicted secreted protein